jgi:hypothetical protein
MEQIDPARTNVVTVLCDRLAAVIASGHSARYVSEMLDPALIFNPTKDD